MVWKDRCQRMTGRKRRKLFHATVEEGTVADQDRTNMLLRKSGEGRFEIAIRSIAGSTRRCATLREMNGLMHRSKRPLGSMAKSAASHHGAPASLADVRNKAESLFGLGLSSRNIRYLPDFAAVRHLGLRPLGEAHVHYEHLGAAEAYVDGFVEAFEAIIGTVRF
jgi:hypothetical protein